MQSKDNKVWKGLTNCWNDLKPSLDQIKNQLQTQLAPLKDQCQTWIQGIAPQELIHLHSRSFTLVKKLGEGGYSFVYLVQEVFPNSGPDAPPGRTYALKKVLADRHTLHEAKHEIDVMRKLNHPNLLTLLDSDVVISSQQHHRASGCGTSGGASHIVYMLFPLCEGGNVWDVVQHRVVHCKAPLQVTEIVNIAVQLCAGLQHMHGRGGVAHFDVKPHNILLSSSSPAFSTSSFNTLSSSGGTSLSGGGLGGGQLLESRLDSCKAVLIDFGSARSSSIHVTNRTAAVALQEEAERHSTAPYRPPELWDVPSSCTINETVDVWAIGCVLYYMMVGESPFERAANEAGGSLMLAIANGVVSWPEDVVSRYPEGLRQLVMACLSIKPESRPDIGNIMKQLESFR